MNEQISQDFNRRDFLRSGSLAALMTMMGGVQLVAQTNAPEEKKPAGPKLKLAVIGLGPWGRELLNTLGRIEQAEVAAICDNYPAFMKRSATAAPKAKQVAVYKEILADKEIKAVLVATPTHQHKEIVTAALKAGKHVYCEAPLAHTVEDARAIAAAAKAAPELVFQSGLQLRADPQRHFLLPFIRSGALGQCAMARAQYHKKDSWRKTAPTPEREKVVNWRLDKALSTGLVGEIGCHQIDQACWFLNARPVAATGFGSIVFWKNDGRDVPDTVQAILEYPGGITMQYNATLANSFDSSYEIFYGSDAAVMLRESSAWMFKEVDSPLLGWEVYATKESFGKETGIVLKAGASKAVQVEQTPEMLLTSTPIYNAVQTFVRNASDVTAQAEDYISTIGDSDPEGLKEVMVKTPRRPAAGFIEGYQATMISIKVNEAITGNKRIEFKPEWYELT